MLVNPDYSNAYITIPGLELIAAHMSANLGVIIQKALEYFNLRSIIAWSGKKIVLHWLREKANYKVFFANEGGLTFHSLLVTRRKFTGCSLLVAKSLVTRCKICSLLVTRCKVTRYSLWNSLVTHWKFTRYWLWHSLITWCRNWSL